MPGTPRLELFASCAPGSEATCRTELTKLGHRDSRAMRGGVTFHGSLADAAHTNLWLRTASRILVRATEFDAPGRRELGSRLKRTALDAFVPPGSAVKLHVTAHKSRLYHTGLIAEVFHEATGLVSAEKDDDAPEVFIRFEHDRCTVSVDTSGELLHRRGYRQDVSRAPLRETLAATTLLLARYDGTKPFLDPMCGSGTLPLEAFLIATNTAPGLHRSFALEQFPSSDEEIMPRLKAEATAAIRPLRAPIFGSDTHAGALSAARSNGERAKAVVEWERVDVARRSAPAPAGLLVTNPPYGKRVGRNEDRSAQASLEALSSALDGAFHNWRAGILMPIGAERPKTAKAHRLDNGGIPVDLVLMDAAHAD